MRREHTRTVLFGGGGDPNRSWRSPSVVVPPYERNRRWMCGSSPWRRSRREWDHVDIILIVEVRTSVPSDSSLARVRIVPRWIVVPSRCRRGSLLLRHGIGSHREDLLDLALSTTTLCRFVGEQKVGFVGSTSPSKTPEGSMYDRSLVFQRFQDVPTSSNGGSLLFLPSCFT